MVWPAALTVGGDADFCSVSALVTATATIAVDEVDVTVPPLGFTAVAMAELVIAPLSMSAWMTVYVAVHVVVAAGASEPAGQVIANGGAAGSDSVSMMPTLLSVVWPVFSTRKLQVTFWPRALTVDGLADFVTVTLDGAVAVTV